MEVISLQPQSVSNKNLSLSQEERRGNCTTPSFVEIVYKKIHKGYFLPVSCHFSIHAGMLNVKVSWWYLEAAEWTARKGQKYITAIWDQQIYYKLVYQVSSSYQAWSWWMRLRQPGLEKVWNLDLLSLEQNETNRNQVEWLERMRIGWWMEGEPILPIYCLWLVNS